MWGILVGFILGILIYQVGKEKAWQEIEELNEFLEEMDERYKQTRGK